MPASGRADPVNVVRVISAMVSLSLQSRPTLYLGLARILKILSRVSALVLIFHLMS